MKHFRIPYSILSHEIMQAERQTELRLFLIIVGNACYKDGVQVAKSQIVLGKGQWLRSQRKLQDDLGGKDTKASFKVIVKATKWLVEKNLIQTENTKLGTVFTVNNFHVYQGEALPTGKHQDELALPTGKQEEEYRFPQESGERFPQGNNTNKEINTNKKDNIYPLSSSKNIKAGFYDERDISTIEWEKYDWKF